MGIVYHDYTGERPSFNTKRRTCKLPDCNTRLNKYNLNEFCHAHTSMGVDERWKSEERKRLRAYKKQKRAVEKKKNERKRSNKLCGV
jgi:hypothetical protein